MSRKTIMAILAVIGAVITFFAEEFGLSINPTAVVAGMTALVLYVLFEAKLDLKKLGAQAGRFKDPKFWLAFLSAVLVAVNESFGLNLPIEAIVSVLTLVMSTLFGVEFQKAKT